MPDFHPPVQRKTSTGGSRHKPSADANSGPVHAPQHQHILHMQRLVGNQAVQRMLKPAPVQRATTDIDNQLAEQKQSVREYSEQVKAKGESGDYAGALKLAQWMLANLQMTSEERAKQLRNTGNSYYFLGNKQKSSDALLKAMAEPGIAPETMDLCQRQYALLNNGGNPDVQSYLDRAIAMGKQHDYEGANELSRKALTMNPSDVQRAHLYLTLARGYHFLGNDILTQKYALEAASMGGEADALAETGLKMTTLVDIKLKSHDEYRQHAIKLARSGDYAGAIDTYKVILKKFDLPGEDRAKYYYFIGLSFYMMNNEPIAKEYMLKVHQLREAPAKYRQRAYAIYKKIIRKARGDKTGSR